MSRNLLKTLAGVITFWAALVSFGAAHAQRFTYGNWNGRALYENGKFDRCAMEAQYNSGIIVMFDVDRSLTWRMWLTKPGWQLTPGGSFSANLVIDRGAVIPVTVSVISNELVMIPLATTSYVVDNMRRGRVMEFFVGDLRIPFSLDGTAQAIPQLVSCVKQTEDRVQTALRPGSDFRMVGAAETAVMLTNLLNQVGVTGYKLTPPRDGDTAAYFSMGNGSFGFLRAARGSDTKSADDYTNDTVGRLTKACKGEFMSGKQNVVSTDGSVVRRVVSKCKEGAEIFENETTIVRQADGQLVEFSIVTSSAQLQGADGQKSRAALNEAVLKLPLRQ